MSSPGATCPVCTASRRWVGLIIFSLSLSSLIQGDVHQRDGQAARLVWRGPGSVSRCHEPPIVIPPSLRSSARAAETDYYKVTPLPVNTVTIAASCWRQGGQPGRLDPMGGRNKVGIIGTHRQSGIKSVLCRVQVRPRPLGCGEPGLECWSVSGLRPRRVRRDILYSPLETDRLPI